MKIKLTCYRCFKELYGGRKEEGEWSTIPDECNFDLQVEDENTYKVTCQNGHEFVHIYSAVKFEILLSSAYKGLKDGYLREAYISAAASLERFYEFVIQVICEKNGLDTTQEKDPFGVSWHNVANSSERQLGGYVFAFLIATKSKAPTLSNTQTGERNRVVHKGEFPNKAAVKKFIRIVVDIMHDALSTLIVDHKDELETVLSRSTSKLIDQYKTIIYSSWLESSDTSIVRYILGDQPDRIYKHLDYLFDDRPYPRKGNPNDWFITEVSGWVDEEPD